MNSTRNQIEAARRSLGIAANELELVAPHRAPAVLRRISDKFTTLGHLAEDRLWWWEHLKGRQATHWPTSLLQGVRGRIDQTGVYWFLAEESESQKRGFPFWLYLGNGAAILRILAETPHFEFYVVENHLEWLLCSNHHNALIGVGTDMVSRLEKLVSSKT